MTQSLASFIYDGPKTYRPWGYFQELYATDSCKVKRVTIRSGAATSLQFHQHRNEHWSIVKGKSKVIRGEQEFLLSAHDSILIPAGQIHRIENIGEGDLDFIEVQTGSYFGEDDIVRLEDRYNRADLFTEIDLIVSTK